MNNFDQKMYLWLNVSNLDTSLKYNQKFPDNCS